MTAGLELLKSSSSKSRYELFYWENLERNASSEVEYIIAKSAQCVPLEVKAGISGKMKSLRVFMKKKNIKVGLRSSLENFGLLEVYDTMEGGSEIERTIGIIPIYAIWNLPNLNLPE